MRSPVTVLIVIALSVGLQHGVDTNEPVCRREIRRRRFGEWRYRYARRQR